MRSNVRQGLDVLAILFLGGIFGYAGAVKILEPHTFAGDLYAFGLLPGWAIAPVAIMLPSVEIVAACALLAPILRLSAASLLLALLLAFIGVGLWVLWRGTEVWCGCFGGASSIIGWPMIVFDALLMVPALWLLLSTPRKRREIAPSASKMEFQ